MSYPYTCDQYESAEACDDGEAYFNFGLNGRIACCICGKKMLVSIKELLSISDLQNFTVLRWRIL